MDPFVIRDLITKLGALEKDDVEGTQDVLDDLLYQLLWKAEADELN